MTKIQDMLGAEISEILRGASRKLAKERASSEPPNPLINPQQRAMILEHQTNQQLEKLSAVLTEGSSVLLSSLQQLSHSRPDINFEKISEELRTMGECINIEAFNSIGPDSLKVDSAAPQSDIKLSQETLLALFDAANALLKAKHFADAEKAFMLLCTIEPSDYDLWIGQGHAAYYNKQYDNAIQAYYLAATLRAEDPWPMVWAANVCVDKEDVEAAIDLLKQAHDFACARIEPEMAELAKDIHERLTLLSHKKY